MAEKRAAKKTSPTVRKERGLRKLSTLLGELRLLGALSEASPGIFRWKSRAFLHFHYFPDGTLIADARVQGTDWKKFDVTTQEGRSKLMTAIRHSITE